MRAGLALAVAACAVAGLAPSADATCVKLFHAIVVYGYQCSPPDGESWTTVCVRDVDCVRF